MTQRRIGIDIGRTGVRVAEVESSPGRRPRLLRFAEAGLEPGAVENAVVQRRAPVVEAVRKAHRASGAHSKDAVVGVAGDRVYVRPISVPGGPAGQVRASLPYLVQDSLPVAVSDCVLDFHPVSQNGPMLDGLLVAVAEESVRANVDAVEKAGLRVVGVDLSAFALMRALTRGREPHAVTAIVDVGADVTQIVIAERTVPRLIRFGPVAGRSLTVEIAQGLGCDEARAEQALQGAGATHPDIEPSVRAHVERLAGMVAQTIAYHAQSGGRPVDGVLLAGRGARVPGLGQYLATVTRLAVSFARTDGGFAVDKRVGPAAEAGQPVLSVAAGLACGSAA